MQKVAMRSSCQKLLACVCWPPHFTHQKGQLVVYFPACWPPHFVTLSQSHACMHDLRFNSCIVKIPTWRIVPVQDVIDTTFKHPEIRAQVRANPYCYKGRPRLNTVNELLNTSLELEQRLHEVSLPFMVLHVGDDRVTDKAVSQLLYDVAASPDKNFKLYLGKWNRLLYGETSENIKIVFTDIINWLNRRTKSGNLRLERELKLQKDEILISKHM
ncbi:uncharacterized protein LOC120194479 [Hibiscus syriacus]|uniref:uncharacterized protein LOC120194479 n=1 Tax=Hibiscus syriacus TaxID=106335 RepID=UPI001923E9F1|nr:uncharacterized protein LOC120194479 [Hibiscus syriacus]